MFTYFFCPKDVTVGRQRGLAMVQKVRATLAQHTTSAKGKESMHKHAVEAKAVGRKS